MKASFQVGYYNPGANFSIKLVMQLQLDLFEEFALKPEADDIFCCKSLHQKHFVLYAKFIQY